MSDFQILILAAGNGTRMRNGGELPKVLVPLNGRPMIEYVLDEVRATGFGDRIALVVSYCAEMVKSALGDGYQYIFQAERRGTGHAVGVAREFLQSDQVKHLIVLYGDHPLVSANTLISLAEKHQESGAVLTMATAEVPDFDDWRSGFNDFGRIVRDEQGRIARIVEKKDATPEELEIRELNPSYLVFNTEWLWSNIDKLTNDNTQGEFYLTDMIGLAVKSGAVINTMPIEPIEALGVNTPEQLALIENLILQQSKTPAAA